MNDSPWYLNALEQATCLAFSCLPSPRPTLEQLRNCKLVGHRGAHQGTPYIENTLPGFVALTKAGVWGAELDIRWTRDLVPVISHDPDCLRLFKQAICIAETDFQQLRLSVPHIPTLAEVVSAVGGKLHLMIEIKNEPYPRPKEQAETLKHTLASLTPITDYHFLALEPDLFAHAPFATLECQVIVGTMNVKAVSRIAQRVCYGGIAGAYPLFTGKRRRYHQQRGQKIGTGHINTQRILFQELKKGTNWIFSNRALRLQHVVNNLLRDEK